MHLCPTCLIARPVPAHLSKMLFGLEDFRSMVSDESSHCMIHDRIDNHRLQDWKTENLCTCGHGRVPRIKQPVKLCLTKSWLRKGLPISVSSISPFQRKAPKLQKLARAPVAFPYGHTICQACAVAKQSREGESMECGCCSCAGGVIGGGFGWAP